MKTEDGEIAGDFNEDASRNESNLGTSKMEPVNAFSLSNEEHRKELQSLVSELKMRVIFSDQNDFSFERFLRFFRRKTTKKFRQTQSADVFATIVNRNFVPSSALNANCLLLVQKQKDASDSPVIEIVEMVAGETILRESLSHTECAFFLR